MANTTTAAQRRDRRRELEAKYGLRSARAMAANNLHRRSPENTGFLPNRFDVFFTSSSSRNSSIVIIIIDG